MLKLYQVATMIVRPSDVYCNAMASYDDSSSEESSIETTVT